MNETMEGSKLAIAQVVEHLTVECCSNQMVPGSVPGGRSLLQVSVPFTWQLRWMSSPSLPFGPISVYVFWQNSRGDVQDCTCCSSPCSRPGTKNCHAWCVCPWRSGADCPGNAGITRLSNGDTALSWTQPGSREKVAVDVHGYWAPSPMNSLKPPRTGTWEKSSAGAVLMLCGGLNPRTRPLPASIFSRMCFE